MSLLLLPVDLVRDLGLQPPRALDAPQSRLFGYPSVPLSRCVLPIQPRGPVMEGAQGHPSRAAGIRIGVETVYSHPMP